MYFAGGGAMPKRKHNVIQGAYPKIGSRPENKWAGIIPDNEMPYVINPEKGYVVSANNHMTTSNVKHGITQVFTFPGRKTRISQLIEEAIEHTGSKIKVTDMQKIQVDLKDVQAQASINDLLYCVENSSLISKLDSRSKDQIAFAKRLLTNWDFVFGQNSSPASVYTAWEFMIGYYMHESSIKSNKLRLSLNLNISSMSSIYRMVQTWAKEKRSDGKTR
jgi:acyl-homoserine lactone acylase PvdQ